MITVGFLALEGCFLSSIYGPFDVFSIANREYQRLHDSKDRALFELKILTLDGQEITTSNGLPLAPHSSIDQFSRGNIIMLPAMFTEFEQLLGNEKLLNWIKTQHQTGTVLCSVCAGSFFLAEAGLLNNRRATTHWYLTSIFKRRYPKVNLKPHQIIVDEGEFITAGGVSSYLDLAIYLLSKFGSKELAGVCSKLLLIDPPRKTQIPYQIKDFSMTFVDEEIKKVHQWLLQNYDKEVKMAKLSRIAGLGERTFLRRFKKALGEAPLEYLQNLRVEKAKKLLELTNQSVEEITWNIGYDDSNSFRRLFKKRAGLSPGAYRKRFSLLF